MEEEERMSTIGSQFYSTGPVFYPHIPLRLLFFDHLIRWKFIGVSGLVVCMYSAVQISTFSAIFPATFWYHCGYRSR